MERTQEETIDNVESNTAEEVTNGPTRRAFFNGAGVYDLEDSTSDAETPAKDHEKPEKAKSTSSNESEEKPPVTHVLLISWKVETVVHEEQALLGSIFYEDYGFPLHSLRLNSWDPPDEQLAAKLKEIDDQLGPDDWLIVHYGGHGGLSVDMSFRISAYIPRALLGWKIVQNQLSKLSCNILLLLDCCYATSVILCAEESFDHRPMEIIVASGSPGLAFSSRHHFRLSFTDKLRAVLKDTVNSDRDLTISDLYNQVLQRTVIENCQTRPRWREEERATCPILPTPVHISFPARVPKRALYTLNQPFCGPRPGRYERDPDEWSEDEDEDEYPRGRKNSDNCSATSGPATSAFNNRGGRVIQESKDVKGKGPEDSQSEGSSSPPLEVAQRARRPY